MSPATATHRLRPAWLFGQFLAALCLRQRSSDALTRRIRYACRLRKRRSSSAHVPRLIGCFGHHRLKVHEARSIIRASVFGQLVRSSASPASGPPNKSFKPTPCRGGSHVLYATLARVRRPATGRLNSGVRRQRAFSKCIVGAATFRLRSALLFGRFVGMSLLRLRPQCALTIRMRRVAWLRKQRSSSASFPYLAGGFGHGRLIVCGARSIIRSSVFGQLVRSSASPASGPPNKSFKPTPCRGVCHVLYATLAHVRRPATGRLNSGVRRQKSFLQLWCSQTWFPGFG